MAIESQEPISVPVLRRVICLATIDPSLGPAEIRRIASDYRELTQCLDVTGILLHKEGMLLHVVEGEHTAVDDLMARMQDDRRQQSLHVSSDERVEERGFHTWNMGTSIPSVVSSSDSLIFCITRAKLEELSGQVGSNLVSSFLMTFVALEDDPGVTVMYC